MRRQMSNQCGSSVSRCPPRTTLHPVARIINALGFDLVTCLEFVDIGLVIEEGERTKKVLAVQVVEGQAALPHVDKVHELRPLKDLEGLRLWSLRSVFLRSAPSHECYAEV